MWTTALDRPRNTHTMTLAINNHFRTRGGIAYVVSQGISMQSGSEYITLRPDIFIPLTIYDVINNIDPVMDFIWAGGVNAD